MKQLDDLFGLTGRVAVVTGASSGLGVEFAETLLGAGASLALISRRRDRLEEVSGRLRTDGAARIFCAPADLTDRESATSAFAHIEREFGRIDILVNNAGIAPTGRAHAQWPGPWDETLATNLTAVFQASLLAAESMIRGGRGGRIINISSIFGSHGSSLFRVASYAASKSGVEGLTRQLAIEWASEGITVNTIAPGWFPSEMTEGSLKKVGISERMGDACPMRRIGRPGELRTACLFLASPASSYVTGTIVRVDGGYAAW
jgi:gluconate 5-dehydrogenase